MIPRVPLREALSDRNLLGAAIAGDSWRSWRTLLIAAMGEALREDERATFRALTGRDREPLQRVDQFAAVVGRRGGKSRAMATLATYIAGLCDHRDALVPGERGVLLCVALDQRVAKIILDYAEACFARRGVGEHWAIQRAASIPDLSGIWGRDWLTFEPPSSGPGPIVSKLRRPDGTLIHSAVGDYTNPILTPQAAEVVKKKGEIELSGAAFPSPHNQCWPEPTPYTLSIQLGLLLIQQKDEVILISLHDQQVRHVRMNVPHSAHLKPSWPGESVGHYEADTLVIDTIGQKVGPLSMVDRFGTPFSTGLRVIERYRLIDGAMARDHQRKHESTFFGAGGLSPLIGDEYGRGDIDPDTMKPGLQVEITVDDPATFTTRWSGFVTYRHVLGEWPEAVCAENMQGSGSSWIVLV